MMWEYNYYGGYPMMGCGAYGGYGASGWVQVILSVAWAFILIALVLAVIRFLRQRGDWHSRHWRGENSALEILKERYAKGEIDKPEFEEKKRDLGA